MLRIKKGKRSSVTRPFLYFAKLQKAKWENKKETRDDTARTQSHRTGPSGYARHGNSDYQQFRMGPIRVIGSPVGITVHSTQQEYNAKYNLYDYKRFKK